MSSPLTCLKLRFTREIRDHGFSSRWSSSNRSSSSISTRLHFSPNHALHRYLLPNNSTTLSLLCAIAATQVSETLPRPTLRDSPSPRYRIPHCPFPHPANRSRRQLILAYSALSQPSVASSTKPPNLPCVLHRECPPLHWVRYEVAVRMLTAALGLLPSHSA